MKPASLLTRWTRAGLSLVQNLMRLFVAGAVLVEAHKLFLSYYAREWSGIQIAGVNGCAGEDAIANADLLEGQTFCNEPINYFPWIELYRRHWQAAAIYYGVAFALILLGGFILHMLQPRGSTTPYGAVTPAPSPADSEHLR